MSDSLDLAKELYEETLFGGVRRFDIRRAVERIRTQKHLRERFFSAPNESYLMLQRRPTHAAFDAPVAYCRIWASGKCEYYDYYARQ